MKILLCINRQEEQGKFVVYVLRLTPIATHARKVTYVLHVILVQAHTYKSQQTSANHAYHRVKHAQLKQNVSPAHKLT